MDLTALSIDAARSAVQERQTTALALAEAYYARIQKEDGQIGAFLTLSKERALDQADRIDRMACAQPQDRKSWRNIFLRTTVLPWRAWRRPERSCWAR